MELMIAMAIIAILGLAVTSALNGMSGWAGKSSAEDALAEDVLTVWKEFNNDIGQSAWWIPDTTQSFNATAFATDRSLLYAPFVVQPAVSGGSSGGVPTNAQLRIFARSQPGDIRFEGASLVNYDLRSPVPGVVADRLLAPSGFASTAAYQQSYFARSQELIFTRASNSVWNRTTDRPTNVSTMKPSQILPPIDRYPGTVADWQGTGKHAIVGSLRPSGWVRSGTTWAPLQAGPYGQVMDACYLYTGGTTLDLRLQYEQQGQPTFQLQDPTQVRLFCYAVVPSPNGLGVGRLVRAYTTTGTASAIGTDEGQRIASMGTTSLVVDRVLSDNVARVVFETARHANDIGITNVRATVYFAKISEHQHAEAPVLHRAVTMVFTMRAANSWQDKADARSRVKTSTTIASGAIPFSY